MKKFQIVFYAVAILLPCVLCVGASANRSNGDLPKVEYPENYREWVHVRTVLVGPQSAAFAVSGGIHHIYANDKAMKGYASGSFPDGSILVFDLLDTKERDGVTSEGARQRIDMMFKDSRLYSATGGWGFERFGGDSKTDRPLTEEHRQQCFNCHAQKKDHDFVFSEFKK